ncbi:long tail fiber protein proximal connector [Escherichia phage UGJNEcP4]|nr:long tail fiber protein proximal connector [Escherichia phage UGJNEcP3]CAH1616852.1 long tail fiber protein proximal connector [Escherichia phage UGJNEcP4]
MAEFGQGYVQVPTLSENNAVRYKLSIAGSCTKSTTKAYVKFQDGDFGPQNFQNGLNLIEIDVSAEPKVVANKTYSFTKDFDVISEAFITYINSIPANRIVCLVSSGRLNASQKLIDWFRAAGSTAFPSKWMIERFEPSYSAFYVSGRNTIVMEHVLYNDGVFVEDVSTPLEVVFDDISDVGGTGYPIRIVEDENTYLSNGGEEIKRFPTDSPTTPCADYNMKPGEFFYLKFQMMCDQELKDSEGTSQMSVRFFDSNSALTGTVNMEIPTNFPAGSWMTFERVIEVPANTETFTLYARKTVASGGGGVRNVMFGEVSEPESQPKSAEFGVNGIRMNFGTETKNMGITIAQLYDKTGTKPGQVWVSEFREKY